jgi:dihydroorotase
MNILLHQATLVHPNSKELHLKKRDILIKNGRIEKIASKLELPNNTKKIALKNLHVSVGWFDASVSFGEPGFEERETLENGVRTAALSGFTDILLNTNTYPIPDKSTSIGFLKNLSKVYDTINVHLLGALTIGSKGEALADLYDMFEKGALAFSDYKKPITNANLLKIALQYAQSFNGLTYSYPQNKEVAHKGVAHEGIQSTLLGLKGIPSLSEHLQIQRDLHLLEYAGGKLHIPTISAKESVKLIAEAKKKGLDVSCSVALHNLWGSDALLNDFDANFNLRPPLRSQEDQKALQKGLIDGTIDLVVSDHNPIDIELKNVEFDNASPGSIGLEASFGVLNSIFGLEKAIELLTKGRSLYNIPTPSLEEGAQATLSLFNPEEEYEFSNSDILSSSHNCMYLGNQLKGKSYGTIINNRITLNE